MNLSKQQVAALARQVQAKENIAYRLQKEEFLLSIAKETTHEAQSAFDIISQLPDCLINYYAGSDVSPSKIAQKLTNEKLSNAGLMGSTSNTQDIEDKIHLATIEAADMAQLNTILGL